MNRSYLQTCKMGRKPNSPDNFCIGPVLLRARVLRFCLNIPIKRLLRHPPQQSWSQGDRSTTLKSVKLAWVEYWKNSPLTRW